MSARPRWRIVVYRRICQGFFLGLALWLALAMSFGEGWWQLSGWPVAFFANLDPLIGLATVLATGTLYGGLAWALVTVAVTLVFGRVFCGWVCPMGTLHQFIGWLGRKARSLKGQVSVNRPHRAQVFKYLLLTWLLLAAAGDLLGHILKFAWFREPARLAVVALLMALVFAWLSLRKVIRSRRRAATWFFVALLAWVVGGFLFAPAGPRVVSLQIGLFDPIALFYRSVDLAVLPAFDAQLGRLWPMPRHVHGGWLIGAVLLGVLLANLWVPRLYCRWICPLGAMLGLLSRPAIWTIARQPEGCTHCDMCERDCEGACAPSGTIQTAECLLCTNCLAGCKPGVMTYDTGPSVQGELRGPNLARRDLVSAAALGIATAPLLRLPSEGGASGASPIVRPPGALPEAEFLARCIKCGHCMRVCPTNVLQPATLKSGVEALWTPVLDNRVGTSGCQHTCTACSMVCPTAAIRPISVDERTGRGAHAEHGPLRIGTSFVDRGRCLPWAMDTPCLVCEENCPVSPKAIFVRETWATVRDGSRRVVQVDGRQVRLDGPPLQQGALSPADHALRVGDDQHLPLLSHDARTIRLAQTPSLQPGDLVRLQVRLLRPYVEAPRCIGCGICEHVCPVSGRAAIAVGPQNESRHPRRRLMLNVDRPATPSPPVKTG